MPRLPLCRRVPIAFVALLPLIVSAEQVSRPEAVPPDAAASLSAAERAHTRGLLADLARHRQGLAVPALATVEIQRHVLDAGTVLIEYELGEPESRVWAVTPTSVAVHLLPGRSQIEATVRRACHLLGSRRRSGEAPARRAAAELSRLLLAPVAAALGDKRILLVLDGALAGVPFAALPDPADPSRSLLLSHEIVRAPSASVLAALRRGERKVPGGIAAVGDPVTERRDGRLRAPGSPLRLLDPEMPGRAGRLRHSAAETAAIARLAAGQGIPTLSAVGFAADRDLLAGGRLDPYAVLHFATHALGSEDGQGSSALLLSTFDRRGRPRPGLLPSRDIAALDLPANLVVLAGCRTAVSEGSRGGGPGGLSRAFMAAGAARVLGTLWDVGDEASAELMPRFYRGLLEDELSPAAALRAAQLDFLRDPRGQAPWHWAGFVLQGDWR